MTPTTTRTHPRVTREDWLEAGVDALDEEPIDQLKILTLAATLNVSRSSFYWYFSDRMNFLEQLLAIWVHNTDSIVARSERHSETAAAACLGVYECWADRGLFNPTLDFAVRDWGRRNVDIAQRVEAADQKRHEALAQMFGRHGYNEAESTVRARLLYHSQLGYYALGTSEPTETRLEYLPYYLQAVAGAMPTTEEIRAFERFIEQSALSAGH